MTLGEYLVGISFNPGKDPLVDKIKRAAADLIDLVQSVPGAADEQHAGAIARCKATAVNHIETAAMWGVKAATKPPRE